MKNAILLHGKPSKEEYYSNHYPSASNSHWLPWLQKQLLIHDIVAQTPEIPHCYDPKYPVWCREFERYDITPETMLVGHSCGAGFLVRWLSEHKDAAVGKVVLVAPSLGKGWVQDDFFEFETDADLVSRTNGVTVFVSDNDKSGINEAASELTAKIKDIQRRDFSGYGHFTLGSMKTHEFPELLEELLKSGRVG